MSKRKVEMAQKKLNYIREQIERFLWKNYRARVNMELYIQKRLAKDHHVYSKITFPENSHIVKTGVVEIDYDYDLMTTKGRPSLLEHAFRDAVRIGLWYQKREFRSGTREFEHELRKHNIPSYGVVAPTGLDLHTYVCSGCEQVWLLQQKKPPKRKDPVEQGYKSGCCGVDFRYDGVIYYDNKKLQIAMREVKRKGYIE